MKSKSEVKPEPKLPDAEKELIKLRLLMATTDRRRKEWKESEQAQEIRRNDAIWAFDK